MGGLEILSLRLLWGPPSPGPGLTALLVWPVACRARGGEKTALRPDSPHLVVNVQLVVFPGLQGLVQVQVTLHCVIL